MHAAKTWALWGALAVATLAASTAARGEESATKVETVAISTPRGAKLEATLHTPAKPNGAAVVLAPGQGYHRELPILKQSAEALSAAGFTALRFDWSYTPAKGQPSKNLADEKEDLEAAIAHAKALPGITKVVLAGKSMGSALAFQRVLSKSDDLAGLVLLTFPIHEPGGKPVPAVEKFGEQTLPTLVVQGDQDPLGMLPALYEIASKAKNKPRVVVVPGDHSFNQKPDDAKGAENVDLAVRAVVLWVRRFVGS